MQEKRILWSIVKLNFNPITCEVKDGKDNKITRDRKGV